MKIKISIAILSVIFLTVACQKPADRPAQEEIESKYFVNGDPMEIVKDTRLNSKTFLTLDNYKEFVDMELSGKTVFTEKTETEKRNQNDMDSVKKSNQTPTEPVKNEDLSSDFNVLEEDKKISLTLGKDSKLILVFQVLGDKSLELVSMGTSAAQLPVKPVHYSVNPEKTAFSILLSLKAEEQNVLFGFSFHKKPAKSVGARVLEAAKRFSKQSPRSRGSLVT